MSTWLDAGVRWGMLQVSSWVKGPSQIKFSNLEYVVRLPSHGIFTPIIYPKFEGSEVDRNSRIERRFEKMKTSLSQIEFRFWTGHSWMWWADHLNWLATRVPHWWVWSFTSGIWGGLVRWLEYISVWVWLGGCILFLVRFRIKNSIDRAVPNKKN